VTITVNVARSEDEAERQARGEDVIAMQMQEDRADAEDAAAERTEIAAEMFDEGRDPEQDIPETADEPKSEEEE
jgi:large subunit ribosomal protein L9